MVPGGKTGQYFIRDLVVSGTGGSIGGAAGGAVDGAFTAVETGDIGDIFVGMGNGALYGGLGAMTATTSVNVYERVRYGMNPRVKHPENWREGMWGKARREYWKNEAENNPKNYSKENIARMKKGAAPQRMNPITGKIEYMQLNHQNFPQGSGLPRTLLDMEGNLKPMWPDEHTTFHKQHGYGKWQ